MSPLPLPVCLLPDGSVAEVPVRPAAVLPGSFNPLHAGHRALAEVVTARFGVEVHFELSTANVDKPDLPADEVARRVRQFAGVGAVWVTRAARFVEKAELFPGTAFVLGFDTAVRLIDPKYYGGEVGRDSALDLIRDFGCRVIVGGRVDDAGTFRVWGETSDGLPARFGELFAVIKEDAFRVDLSSTELRSARSGSARAGMPVPQRPAGSPRHVTSCPSPSSPPSTRRTS